MIGLLGGVHCIGMCGGIVTAFSTVSKSTSRFPVVVSTVHGTGFKHDTVNDTLHVMAYNLGRLSSYAGAGAIAGGIVGGAQSLTGLSAIQFGGYWLANGMLVVLGLYLMGIWQGLTQLERAGQIIWRQIQPLTKSLLPMDSLLKALALGSVWGWLPCGMVYSVLLTALLSGSAWSGATVMLVFGIGTLPALLTMGLLSNRLQQWTQHRVARMTAGVIVLSFGLLGLLRATHGLPPSWVDTLCLNPPTRSP